MRRLMAIYKPFSVIAVPFPFTDLPHTKLRPALVVSSENHQKQTRHVTLLMITTAKKNAWYDDYGIKHLSSTGLKVPSVVRQKLFTLDARLVRKAIGQLNGHDALEVKKRIKNHLNL